MSLRGMVAAAALLAACAMAGNPAAAAQTGIKAGFLTCTTSSGWGFILGSSRSVKCEYSPGPGAGEHYSGSITKFGVDIGYLKSAVMVSAVGAAVDLGVGANALVGGSGNRIMLQPLSIEGQTGRNVAAGIAALQLTSEKAEK